jgi:hypothetical protein
MKRRRFQYGCLTKRSHRLSEDVWQFRFYETTAEGQRYRRSEDDRYSGPVPHKERRLTGHRTVSAPTEPGPSVRKTHYRPHTG